MNSLQNFGTVVADDNDTLIYSPAKKYRVTHKNGHRFLVHIKISKDNKYALLLFPQEIAIINAHHVLNKSNKDNCFCDLSKIKSKFFPRISIPQVESLFGEY